MRFFSLSSLRRAVRVLAWVLVLPLVLVVLLGSYAYWQVDAYMAAHQDRIFTGISVLDIDLSGKTREEASALIAAGGRLAGNGGLTLSDSLHETNDLVAWDSLGIYLDVDKVVDEAFDFGRTQPANLREIFDTWYFGRTYAPVWIIDEERLINAIDVLAAERRVDSTESAYAVQDAEVSYTAPAPGYQLDKSDLRTQILAKVGSDSAETIALRYDEVAPGEASVESTALQLSELLVSERSLYVEEPYDSDDLEPLVADSAEIRKWVVVDDADNISIDERAVRNWLQSKTSRYARSSIDARFYFDDFTKELVLIEPHVSGREFDLDATVERLISSFDTLEVAVPIAFNELVPAIHSDVTGAELGITELLAEETTWFFDSPDNRKQNILAGASKFYGIMVKPGEEFSFNDNLGAISYENGFADGLVIIGGRTQAGIGGGICQVSTTMFQTAFWAGLDIGERNQHGYRVSYYEQAPKGIDKPLGMDAAIYSSPNDPSLNVDFTFINNTPHHILIESYYHELDESLTVKFYSTDIGRIVERNITTADEQPAPPDRYVYSDTVEDGEFEQVEWAADGGIASVYRVVYNRFGDVRDEDYFVSRYTPWANVYQYGDGADIP